ncbi:MAG: hypothetical protein ACTSR3_19590 [Candidatus Helarchaeota archaeon]
MQLKVYSCLTCGYELDVSTGDIIVCEYCGTNNVLDTLKKDEDETKKKFEEMFGKIEHLEAQIRSSGDIAAREYIFNKDFKPRIDTAFQDLEERFEEHFRRPIFQVDLLKQYNPNFNVKKVFLGQDGKIRNWDENFNKDLNLFSKNLLGQPVMNELAAGENSKKHIKTLKARANFLANLYAARGKASVKWDLKSLKYIKNLITAAKKYAMELIEMYENDESNRQLYLNYNAWAIRLSLNESFTQILIHSFKGNLSEVYSYYEQIISETSKKIENFRKLHETNEKLFPLYFIISIIEGLNVDLQIFKFFQKLSDAMITAGVTYGLNTMLENVYSFMEIANTKFNGVTLKDWDSDWIENLEESMDRVFQLIDKIVEVSKIKTGETKILMIQEVPFDYSSWLPNTIIKKNMLDKKTINLRADAKIFQRIDLLMPIAYINAYIIAGKGFWFKKAGEDFEAPLFCNPFFRLDPYTNEGQYSRPLSYLFIPEEKEGKKIKDPLELYILKLLEFIESDQRISAPPGYLILPLVTTKKEIEGFIQHSYELLEKCEATKTELYKGFKKAYKNIKIEKNFESLSGEVVDYIYLPVTLFEIAYGVEKAGLFQEKGKHSWEFITPFINNSKKPFNNYLRIQIEPTQALFNLINLAAKLYQ